MKIMYKSRLVMDENDYMLCVMLLLNVTNGGCASQLSGHCFTD